MTAPCAHVALDIHAPLDLVWTVMLDVSRYREWNPFIIAVENPPQPVQLGSRLRLCVRWANGQLAHSSERVTRLTSPTSLPDGLRIAHWAYAYTGGLAQTGLVRATREQHLSQTPGGPTAYRTEEFYRGLLARWVPVSAVQDGFERHAQALRARAEALAALQCAGEL